ncbi:MAG: sn-glycerol-3-phosphate ABC transporter ATP-binding protein UgpC [Melioribacteraceae bacterium]|nr:sn-glycerol-3-phosphate ABC transporter ATP-binding protein UgpC [Melioribacteraceae bacterium]
MSKVQLNNIEMSYGDTKVLHNISTGMKDGEFVVLVGPSGCGKSTTLRIIAGLEMAQSGEVFIGDRDVTNIPPKDRNIAMVFQNYALYPHMTVFDNMAFGLKLRKVDKKEIEKRVNDAAAVLDITELLKRKPKALSGGQRQRVALGRAIVRQPDVFLFDEPLSNLDAKLRVQMRTEIKKMHHRLKTTMIYVTHDQTEAMTMGDRIVVMKDGYIMQTDKALDLYNHPVNKFTAGFIGSPSMNFFNVTIENHGSVILKEGNFSITLPDNNVLKNYPGKAITLGIRPENLHLTSDSTNSINGLVEVVELMGNESFLHVTTGSNNYIAKVPADSSVSYNQNIFMKVDFDKLHFFDMETGNRIE